MNNFQAKQYLTSQQLAIFNSEYEGKKKTPVVMYLLWLFLGGLGGHRYYLGDTGMGIAMTFTLGGLGFWALIDVFFIGNRLKQKNEQLENELLVQLQNTTPSSTPVPEESPEKTIAPSTNE